MKEKTKSVIRNLRQADYLTVMVTGDSTDTSISISKSCGIIRSNDEIVEYKISGTSGTLERVYFKNTSKIENKANYSQVGVISGDQFSLFCERHNINENTFPIEINDEIKRLARSVRVYSRMNPQQKAIAVRMMQSCLKRDNFTVAFCGDGANDTLALAAADIGVCISKADGALISPFVSHDQEVTCMESVLLEGKAALTTNFDYFRFFCTYSIIQTLGMMVLMRSRTEYSSPAYILFDILLALNLCNCLGLLNPKENLDRRSPKYTLLYWEYLTGIIAQCTLAMVAILVAKCIVETDSNFKSGINIAAEGEYVINEFVATFETTVDL